MIRFLNLHILGWCDNFLDKHRNDEYRHFNFEFSFFSEEILMFNGLDTIKLR
jgi:hypothetical protein